MIVTATKILLKTAWIAKPVVSLSCYVYSCITSTYYNSQLTIMTTLYSETQLHMYIIFVFPQKTKFLFDSKV